MTDEQFKQLIGKLDDVLDTMQSIEDALYDANLNEHNEKVEWNLWEIHNLAKFLVKGRQGTIESLPDERPPRNAERKTEKTEE